MRPSLAESNDHHRNVSYKTLLGDQTTNFIRKIKRKEGIKKEEKEGGRRKREPR